MIWINFRMPFQGLEIFDGFFVHPGFSSWAEIACPFRAIALKGQVMIALGRTQGIMRSQKESQALKERIMRKVQI